MKSAAYSIIHPSGNVQITEGTTISSVASDDNEAWSYTVKPEDKRIKLKSKRDHIEDIEMEVIENDVQNPAPLTLREDANVTFSNLTFITEYNPKIIFSDDYECLSIHFPKYYINIKSRTDIISNVLENEQIALDTLREMITEKEFRKYLKYGFILVHGQSGNVYQIFRRKAHTKVWKNGTLIKEICVRITDNNIPLTDNLIAFKTMIEIDEEEFERIGNVYQMVAA